MELIVDYESLVGSKNEIVVKELAVAGKNILQTFHFRNPYAYSAKIKDLNAKSNNGINWEDGYIPYSIFSTVLNEAVAGFTHLYAYGEEKCLFLEEITQRTFINLQQFQCPPPTGLKLKYHCILPCHKFNDVHCACKHAQALFKWIKYHMQAKQNVKCPLDSNRHNSAFISAVN